MLGKKIDVVGAATDKFPANGTPPDRFTIDNNLIFQNDYAARMGDSKQGILSRIVNTTPHVFVNIQPNTVSRKPVDNVIFGRGGAKASIPASGLFNFLNLFKADNIGGN